MKDSKSLKDCNDIDSEDELSPELHKKSLEKLKKIDPDFYSFLEENDENLLNFDDNSGDEDEFEDEDEEKLHKPGPLQGDSDESDFEDEDAKNVHGKVNLKLVAQWQTELQKEGKIKLPALVTAIKAFNAAMLRVTSLDGNSQSDFKVEGSSVFNAVIQMCVLNLPGAIKKYLGMDQSGKDPQKFEVLTTYDFNKKHKKVSMKPLDFSCILRLAKSQLSENGFKDAVIERIYALLLEYTANESHNIAFPDISLLAILQIKQFLKSCNVSNYTKKLRQLMEKIEENSRFIERERSKISFALSDEKLIVAWESNTKSKGTPLYTFFENWYKINKIQKRKKVSKNDEIAGELPMIKRAKIFDAGEFELKVESKSENKGPMVLFPSDSEDETENLKIGEDDKDTQPKVKKIRKKDKIKSKIKKPIQAEEDIADKEDVVQDFSVSDW
ncbi:unnamed protein product, partial [Iphiclides podalirius]